MNKNLKITKTKEKRIGFVKALILKTYLFEFNKYNCPHFMFIKVRA